MSQQLTESFVQRVKEKFTFRNSSYILSRKYSRLQLLDNKFSGYLIASETNFKPWQIIENVAGSQFDVSTMKPCVFLRGRNSTPGHKMREWAQKLDAYWGYADGKRMLVEQYKIPARMQEYYIPLPGMVLCTPDGDSVVPYLCYENARWVMDFNLLDYDWPDNGRLAMFAKSVVEDKVESTIMEVA